VWGGVVGEECCRDLENKAAHGRTGKEKKKGEGEGELHAMGDLRLGVHVPAASKKGGQALARSREGSRSSELTRPWNFNFLEKKSLSHQSAESETEPLLNVFRAWQ